MERLSEKRRGFYGTLAPASNPCCDKKKRNPEVALNPPKEEGGEDNVAKAQGGGRRARDGTHYAAANGAVQYHFFMPRSLFHISEYIS
jgi:hypothetical protein